MVRLRAPGLLYVLGHVKVETYLVLFVSPLLFVLLLLCKFYLFCLCLSFGQTEDSRLVGSHGTFNTYLIVVVLTATFVCSLVDL